LASVLSPLIKVSGTGGNDDDFVVVDDDDDVIVVVDDDDDDRDLNINLFEDNNDNLLLFLHNIDVITLLDIFLLIKIFYC